MPKKNFIILILIINLALLIFGLRWVGKVEAGSEHNVWGWAWSAKEVSGTLGGVGWFSFNAINCAPGCTGLTCVSGGGLGCLPIGTTFANYGVNIDDEGKFSGHAWVGGGMDAAGNEVPVLGWIRFDPSAEAYLINGYPGSPYHSARVSTTTGEVSGWARACAGTANPGTCNGDPNSAAGGWDGWIKLGDSPHLPWPAGGQQVYIATTTGHFHGWAWGGGGQSAESAIIGWLSFNCETEEAAGFPNVCSDTDDYKVMTDFSFTPPVVVSNLNWSFPDPCTQSRIPTFTWDVDTTDPFDYQIRLCGDAGCAVELVLEERSGVNSGYWAPSCSYCCSVGDYNNISFGGINYSAQVRARHVGTEWMDDWTSVDFTTYEHCYPWVDFDWSPKPVEVDSDVDFEDRFTCYDVPIGDRCDYNIVIPSHAWTFPGIEGTNYECIDPAVNCGFAQDPKIKFLSTFTSGSQVYLEVCDSSNYCCLGDKSITVMLPLPEYREVRPRSQLDNFLARLSNIFTGF